MTTANLDVVGIGNAIVDVIAHADDAFLAREGLVKGTMTLIDAPRAEALYRMMGPAVEISGGSAGNTMAGIASLGGNGAYIGKVRDDFLGQVFRHDITAPGVRFDTPAATSGPGTARCLILVTARRAAHDEHLSRRLRRARPRRHRPRPDRCRPRSPISKATCSTRRRRRRRSARPPRSPMPPGARWR